MALQKEQERLCRRLGNVESLAGSLGGQALMLCDMGRVREALPLAEEAHQLAAKHGYAALVKRTERLLEDVRRAAEGT